jgi:hypothetical protein
MMDDYIVLSVSTTHYWKAAEQLVAAVNSRLKKGWELVGGVSISHRGDTHEVTMAQAMAKPAGGTR